MPDAHILGRERDVHRLLLQLLFQQGLAQLAPALLDGVLDLGA